MKKDLINEYELTRSDFDRILKRAKILKKMLNQGVSYMPLKGKTLGMIFDKVSTRTRISFEVGMYQLGGLAVFLSSRDTQVGRGESIADSARVMSRYLNGIMIRTYLQEDVEEYAHYATVPVINGLTDQLHPCQIISDLYTIWEKKGVYEGLKIAYVGDGNNMANSWINLAARLPIKLTLACPVGYEPDAAILKRAEQEAELGVTLYHQPEEAIAEAQVIYTDAWTSMGQEAEKETRERIFYPYQINEKLLQYARADVLIMHCLPAYRGKEITSEVIDGPLSIIYDQAENRLHVQKAIMEILMSEGEI